MPELPDLEVMRDALESRILRRPVRVARVLRPGILKTVEPPLSALTGRSFTAVLRRGKHLVLTVDEGLHLVIHLMVAGRLVLCSGATKATKATGFLVTFEDGEDLRLIENGSVKRARVFAVRDPHDVVGIASAGPEPLTDAFTVGILERAFAGRRRQLKHAITDPTVIAGIGTAYADEILFAARLSPIRYVSTMSRAEIEALRDAIRDVLRRGIEEIQARSGGVLLAEHVRDHMQVYGRAGDPCSACGGKIAEIRYAETTTYYCPRCQSKGRALSDRRAWLTR